MSLVHSLFWGYKNMDLSLRTLQDLPLTGETMHRRPEDEFQDGHMKGQRWSHGESSEQKAGRER